MKTAGTGPDFSGSGFLGSIGRRLGVGRRAPEAATLVRVYRPDGTVRYLVATERRVRFL